MAYTNPQNPTCPNCNKSGLAILPVRYAVVSESIPGSLPGKLGNKVTNVKLAHHKYVLRTLRQGYVYLYHEKHPRGSQIKWEVYSVSSRGTLWKQASPDAIEDVSEDPACASRGHKIPASVIAIDRPESGGKVWIAFSQHHWSAETFESFGKDVKLRERRMQTFDPKLWIKSADYRHGVPGTQENVEKIIEYQDNFATSSLVGGEVGAISKPDGSFDPVQLKKETTCHLVVMRKHQSKDVSDAMQRIGEKPDGKHNTPVILALWDAVGMTHELNGFRNDAAGRIELYQHERVMEISAVSQIEGVKVALENRAAQVARNRVEAGIFRWDSVKSGTRLNNFAKFNPGDTEGYKREADLCARWEHDAEQKVPQLIADMRQRYISLPQAQWEARNKVIDKQAQRALQERTFDSSKTVGEAREENAQRAEKVAVAEAWPKYEGLLSKSADGKFAYQEFKKKHEDFLAAVDKLMIERTDDLIAWLKSPSLLDALSEYHGLSGDDGMAFNDVVGDGIFGMNASINGKEQIMAWVKEMRATESNLLWRGMGMNDLYGMAALTNALQEAEKHREDQTLASAIDWVNYTNKSLKAFADTYKKFVSVNNANTSAASAAGSTAFGIKLKDYHLRGADKLAMTVGDSVFSHVRINTLADHASEKIIQHLFSIRSFVDPSDSARLIIVQTQNEKEARGQLARRLRAAKTFLAAGTPALLTAQTQNLTNAWTEFQAKNPKGAGSALKDSRLALLVMLIEGSNFSKLIADCAIKNDAKSWWSLAASATSITSALFDIASIPAKNLFGADSWSYQRLKGTGGVLSTAATAVGVVFDAIDARKASAKGQDGISLLYNIKALLGGANAGLTIATTFTYAAPMIGRITGNAAIGTAARVISVRAAAIIGCRILFMSAGAWVTVGVFGIQVLIWFFSDNELQSWCALSTFGTRRRAPDAFKSAPEQNAALEKALIEVGLKHE